MIAVPKDILIKLFENQIESGQLQQQKYPIKCQCHCQCGRYPNDMLIVDKVMTDILESSNNNLGNFENNNTNNVSIPSSSVSSHNIRRDSKSFFAQQQMSSSKMDTSDSSNPENNFFNGNSDFLTRPSINGTTTSDFNNCKLNLFEISFFK